MVVDRHSELLLGFVLPNHVAVEKGLYLGRARQAAVCRAGLFALLVLENLLADADTFIADIGARVFRWRADEFLDLLLRFMAEGTAQRFFWGEPFHLLRPPYREPHSQHDYDLL